MVYRIILALAMILTFSLSLLARQRLERPLRPEASPMWQCRKIVSMAPSITETLYRLVLGDQVAGVTRDCRYPPEAMEKKQIGGYFDPNYEAILEIQPDLVIMLKEQAQSLPGFEKLKLETLVVSHQTIDGVIDSFRTIGRICGKGEEGRELAAEYENRLNRIREKTRDLRRTRVLMAIDRNNRGQGRLSDVYVVGDDKYFDQIIDMAGGENVCRQPGIRYPVVSSESILWLNPDVIVDMVYPDLLKKATQASILEDWNELGQVEAVKSRRVMVFSQDYATVPGPRIIQLVEDLARALHPEVDWNEE